MGWDRFFPFSFSPGMLTAMTAEEGGDPGIKSPRGRIFQRLRDKREVGSDRFSCIREAPTAFFLRRPDMRGRVSQLG